MLTGSGPLEEVWLLLLRETEARHEKRVLREIIKSDKYIYKRDCKYRNYQVIGCEVGL